MKQTLSSVTILLTILFGWIWKQRLRFYYNSEGKYFDEIDSVTYDEDALLVFGVLTFLFGFISIVCFIIIWKHNRSKKVIRNS